jgi:hypothetical protein
LTPEQFRKVEFRDAASLASGTPVSPSNLFMQIDGFQEMDERNIETYLRELAAPCKFCFVSNPVGKYAPELAGVEGIDPEGAAVAMQLGKSRSIVDPWNEESLRTKRSEHADAYRPPGHRLLQVEPSRLRPYYLHAMYAAHDAA